MSAAGLAHTQQFFYPISFAIPSRLRLVSPCPISSGRRPDAWRGAAAALRNGMGEETICSPPEVARRLKVSRASVAGALAQAYATDRCTLARLGKLIARISGKLYGLRCVAAAEGHLIGNFSAGSQQDARGVGASPDQKASETTPAHSANRSD
jgi:hypothetical protein